jgi:hypothetical protein
MLFKHAPKSGGLHIREFHIDLYNLNLCLVIDMSLQEADDTLVIPIPENEKERLSALRDCGILDTPEDESFSRLTRLAAMLTGAPISVITFVDEFRQWFKASVGIGATTETPRNLSFCTHAMMPRSIFDFPVIPWSPASRTSGFMPRLLSSVRPAISWVHSALSIHVHAPI